ncbi:hypothetical protein K0504_01645 [Neiella marina]|uniref:Na(+)/drug antiporter n=2 Tax=Neiella holothuriorum TaxID=2870530 RepID=A0ABS7EBV9_9GAMM|nr:hypothetical protein [Neiella holothuriorum]
MQSMLIIDTLLVSPLGEVPLAAMGIASTILAFALGVQLALANGTQLIVGRVFGANDQQGLASTVINGLLINLAAAFLFLLIFHLWLEPAVNALTDRQDIADKVQEYLAVGQYILLLNALAQTIIALLNGRGDTKTPFQAYLLELPFNAVVSFVLIFGVSALGLNWQGLGGENLGWEGLGFVGAAFGSLAAITVRLLYLLWRLAQQTDLPAFTLKFNRSELTQHFAEIWPVATNFIVLSVGNTVYQLLFAQLNIYSYVAITLIFPWLRIATQFIVAWAQANSISITQAIGKGRHNHLALIVRACIKLGALMACAVSAALFGFSLLVEVVYPNVTEQTYVALASIAPLYIALPLVRTFNTIAGNSLRAMGRSVQVLKIHFVTQWLVGVPLCGLVILYFDWGLVWAFALLPIEELLKAIPFYRLLRHQLIDGRDCSK